MILVSLSLGIAFGVVATLRHFCLHGSLLENFTNKRTNTGRLASFLIAMALTLLFVQLLNAFFPLRLEQSVYLTTRLNIVALVLGGMLFGIGMMLAQGCVSRHIIKLASGHLMSLPTLLLVGLCAFAAIAGVFAVPLAWLQEYTSVQLDVHQSIPELLQHYGSLPIAVVRIVVVGFLIACLLLCAYLVRQKGQPLYHYWDGLVIAFIITLGWLATTVGFDEFDELPVAAQSLTFTLPVGRTMQYFMLSTSYVFDFTVALVCGAFLGALVTNLVTKTFRFSTFADKKETLHAIIGSCLMGVGGIMAVGCNVGQGLSGFSTLSLGSMIALISILIGSSIVIAVRDRGLLRE